MLEDSLLIKLEVFVRGLWLVVLLGGLTACVTTTVYKHLIVSHTDKAVGRIQMELEYEAYQIPVPDFNHALVEAVKLCRDWGYEHVTPLEEMSSQCVKGSESACQRYVVTYNYQCLTAEQIKNYQEANTDSANNDKIPNEKLLESTNK